MKKIFKPHKTYKFRYGIITPDKEIILFNNSIVNHSMLNDESFLNVEVLIDKSGLLHFKGEKFLYNLTIDKINVEELDEPVLEKYILYSKGNKFFGIKPRYYVQGWYCLKRREPVKYIMNNFKIKIKE